MIPSARELRVGEVTVSIKPQASEMTKGKDSGGAVHVSGFMVAMDPGHSLVSILHLGSDFDQGFRDA